MVITASIAQSLTLQLLVSALILGFGVLARRVAPAPGGPVRTTAWFLAGVTFVAQGVVATLHSILAIVAVAAGPGTRFWNVYMRLMPAANEARNMVVLGFALALAWVVLLGRPSPRARAVVAAAVALMAAGTVIGLFEPPVQAQGGGEHFGIMSYFGAATAVLLFAVLYRAMVAESIDWLLWVALALYAVQEALSSNIQMVLSWAGFGGNWRPPNQSMHWAGLVAAFVMFACTLQRLAIARRGAEPPGLLERLRG